MFGRSLRRIIVGFLFLTLMACSSGVPALPQNTRPASTSPTRTPTEESTSVALLPIATTHPTPTGHFLLLKSAVPIPATCPVNPVYAGSLGIEGLTDVPWVKADPLSSQITAFLFFVEPSYRQTHLYQPLHTGGGYPDGSRNTKILWVLNVSAPPDTVVITGVNISSPHETFQQTFPIAGAPGPGWDYPSIVTIPAPGCWQIQVNGAASLIFWVTGN
jgi:hypothetical protein